MFVAAEPRSSQGGAEIKVDIMTPCKQVKSLVRLIVSVYVLRVESVTYDSWDQRVSDRLGSPR